MCGFALLCPIANGRCLKQQQGRGGIASLYRCCLDGGDERFDHSVLRSLVLLDLGHRWRRQFGPRGALKGFAPSDGGELHLFVGYLCHKAVEIFIRY